MEPSSTTASTGTANNAPNTGNGLSVGAAGGNMLKEQAEHFTTLVTTTDIKKINGYMRLANLVGSLILGAVCVIRLFSVSDYAHFLVIAYIVFLAVGLAFIENHEQFPSLAEKVKINFGFMFTAIGKATYILSIAFLAFSQGLLGCLLGAFFIILASFNFFLIVKHPAYRDAMRPTDNKPKENPDIEAQMPELRYNNASKPAPVQPAQAPVPVPQATSHVSV